MQCTPPPTVEITVTIDANHNVTVSGDDASNDEINLRALGCMVPLKFTIASSAPGHTYTFAQDAILYSHDRSTTNKNTIDNSSHDPEFNRDITRTNGNSVLTLTYNNLGSYCGTGHRWGNIGFILSDNGSPQSFPVDPIIDNGTSIGSMSPHYCVALQHHHHHSHHH